MNTTEPTPDLVLTQRVLDDPATPNTGIPLSGTCQVVEMGAYEFQRMECWTGKIIRTEPASDDDHWFVDARRPHPVDNPSLSARRGLGSAEEPIRIILDAAGSSSILCWDLCETGFEQTVLGFLGPNRIVSIAEEPGIEENESVYTILLDRPISSGHWTTIRYLGDVEFCGSRATFGALPADVDDNHVSTATDVFRLRDALNGGWQPPVPAEFTYRTDLNRSDALNPQDLITALDLLNGADYFFPWKDRTLPATNCRQDQRPGGGPGGAARPSASSPDLDVSAPRPKGENVQPVTLPPDP